MEQSTLTKYVELERQIKQLEEQKKMLRDSIQADLEADGAKTVKTDLATFSITEKKSWSYSDAVSTQVTEIEELKAPFQEKVAAIKEEEKTATALQEAALKDLKEDEEKNGTATCEVSKSLRVQLAK